MTGTKMKMLIIRKEFGLFTGLLKDGVRYTGVILVNFDIGRYTLISSQQ